MHQSMGSLLLTLKAPEPSRSCAEQTHSHKGALCRNDAQRGAGGYQGFSCRSPLYCCGLQSVITLGWYSSPVEPWTNASVLIVTKHVRKIASLRPGHSLTVLLFHARSALSVSLKLIYLALCTVSSGQKN